MTSYTALAPYYDALTADVPYREFVEYYDRAFRHHSREIRTVLDLGCGTGTLTRILSEMGYEMVSVDRSVDMLVEAQAKTDDLAVPPLLLCQDITALDLYGTVDAAVSCLDVLNYVPTAKLPEVFRRLSLFIEPGGLLLFDIHSPERLRNMDGQVNVDETEDVYCVWRAAFDENARRLRYDMDIFIRANKGTWLREFEEHIEYAHEPDEVEKMMRDSGFTDIRRTDGPLRSQGRIHFSAIKGD